MVNVIPENDEREHIMDTWCWCEPEVELFDPKTGKEYPNGPVINHHAADCREVVEGLTGERMDPDKFWTVYETVDE